MAIFLLIYDRLGFINFLKLRIQLLFKVNPKEMDLLNRNYLTCISTISLFELDIY